LSLILDGTNGLSDVDGSAATPAIRGTDANTGMFFPAADTIAFSEGGVESMRINSAGEVLIGTTTSNGAILRAINGSGTQIMVGFSGTQNYYDANNHIFRTANGAANVMTTDSSGNVGIGTSSPLARLHIEGNSSGTVQTFIKNANGSTNSNAELVFGVWSGAIPTGTGNPGPSAKISAINIANADARTDLAFFTYSGSGSSTERMRILNTGNILCLAGGSTTTTGTGITFPATQSASSDANTLDDYEEGTVTLTLSSLGNTSTATYTKIGRFVIVNFSLSVPVTSSSANAFITGFPFVNRVSNAGLTKGYTNGPQSYIGNMDNGSAQLGLFSFAGALYTWASFSSTLITGSVAYQTDS
jgi:hypothetical protein